MASRRSYAIKTVHGSAEAPARRCAAPAGARELACLQRNDATGSSCNCATAPARGRTARHAKDKRAASVSASASARQDRNSARTTASRLATTRANGAPSINCTNQACISGVCTGLCEPLHTKCSGNGVQTCDSSGQWQVAVDCTNQACVAGACTGECVPTTRQCGLSQTPAELRCFRNMDQRHPMRWRVQRRRLYGKLRSNLDSLQRTDRPNLRRQRLISGRRHLLGSSMCLGTMYRHLRAAKDALFAEQWRRDLRHHRKLGSFRCLRRFRLRQRRVHRRLRSRTNEVLRQRRPNLRRQRAMERPRSLREPGM